MAFRTVEPHKTLRYFCRKPEVAFDQPVDRYVIAELEKQVRRYSFFHDYPLKVPGGESPG